MKFFFCCRFVHFVSLTEKWHPHINTYRGPQSTMQLLEPIGQARDRSGNEAVRRFGLPVCCPVFVVLHAVLRRLPAIPWLSPLFFVPVVLLLSTIELSSLTNISLEAVCTAIVPYSQRYEQSSAAVSAVERTTTQWCSNATIRLRGSFVRWLSRCSLGWTNGRSLPSLKKGMKPVGVVTGQQRAADERRNTSWPELLLLLLPLCRFGAPASARRCCVWQLLSFGARRW